MKHESLEPALRDALAAISTNTLSALLLHNHGMWTRCITGVSPLHKDHARFVGPAFTVRCVPVREDMERHSSMANRGNPHFGTFDTIPAGCVVVYSTGGDTRSGSLGDVLMAVLKTRGVAGFVSDGAVRDGDAIAQMGMPVFCAAVTPPPIGRSLYTIGVQEIIGCGEVMVCPNDIVVADPDGVVVIPRHLAAEITEKGKDKEAIELWVRARIERGEPQADLYPPSEEVIAEYHRWRESGGKL
jgi:regulator of RNase E activity RraA